MSERADAVSAPGCLAGCRPRRPCGPRPFQHPRVRVAVVDPGGGSQHLADIRGLPVDRAERVLQTELKVVVGEKWVHHRTRLFSPSAPLTEPVRLAAHTTRMMGISQLKIVFARRVSIAPAIRCEGIIAQNTSAHISVSCRFTCLKRGDDQNWRGTDSRAYCSPG